MEKEIPIPCPQCKKPTVYSTKNPYRPFCSERCQLIDLGDWANEKFAIPAEEKNDTQKELGDEDEDGPI